MNHSFAILLPWEVTSEAGGVNQATLSLLGECGVEGLLTPILIEHSWDTRTYAECQKFGFLTLRLRSRALLGGGIKASLAYILYFVQTIYTLTMIVRKYNVAAVNAQFPGFDVANYILLQKLSLYRGKVIITFQGSDVRNCLSLLGMERRLMKWILRNADAVVCVSRGLEDEIREMEPQAAFVVIPNGVSLEKFALGDDQEAVRDRIVSVGKYEHRKGHDILLAAFKRIVQKRPSCRLQIIGVEGPKLLATRNLVAELELNDYVETLVNVPHSEVRNLLGQAAVVVLASRWVKGKMGEGFPLAILEAGALCRPVVSTRTTGADELIGDGETGLLVDTEEPLALARAILELLENPDAAAKMGSRLRGVIEDKYQWRHAWRSYRSILDQ